MIKAQNTAKALVAYLFSEDLLSMSKEIAGERKSPITSPLDVGRVRAVSKRVLSVELLVY
jgi:hypothetical protein